MFFESHMFEMPCVFNGMTCFVMFLMPCVFESHMFSCHVFLDLVWLLFKENKRNPLLPVGAIDAAVGAGAVIVGPQRHLTALHQRLHECVCVCGVCGGMSE